MDLLTAFPAVPLALVCVIVVLAIWETIWKFIAMWKSARHNQIAWFVCIAIFNTIGILPIVYILFFQKDRNVETQKSRKKR
jgi:predicted permease